VPLIVVHEEPRIPDSPVENSRVRTKNVVIMCVLDTQAKILKETIVGRGSKKETKSEEVLESSEK
jgi:hypothetical protein